MVPSNVPLESALRGDPLGVLRRTEEASDPRAWLARAAALGQLGELTAARALARRAATALAATPRLALKAQLVEAELAVEELDLEAARGALDALSAALALHDPANAAWAELLAARAAQLAGEAEEATSRLAAARGREAPPHVRAMRALAEAEHFARWLAVGSARRAIARARSQGVRSETLAREIDRTEAALGAPVARVAEAVLDLDALARGLGVAGACRCVAPRRCPLEDVAPTPAEASTIVVDACRGRVIAGELVVDLAARPALFELLAAIARAPGGATVEAIARAAFGARVPNASHEVRLRVELGRLRRALGGRLGALTLAQRKVRWDAPRPVVVIDALGPIGAARVLALLGDGRAWPTRAVAAALGRSTRTSQRELAELEARGAIVALGRARARRWVAAETFSAGTWLLGEAS